LHTPTAQLIHYIGDEKPPLHKGIFHKTGDAH